MTTTKKPVFMPGVTSSGVLPGIVNPGEQKANNTYGMHYINIDKIEPSEKNKRYPQIDLESLAVSIKEHGLFHNLVTTKPNKDGVVRLISGERRYHACNIIREKYPEEFETLFPGGLIPCKTVGNISDVDEEIALIEANIQVRTTTLQSKLDDINRLTELYEMREKQDSKRVSAQIAESLKMSERQVYKYMALNNLNPVIRDALEKNLISINIASEIGGFGETEQALLADILQNEGTLKEEDIKAARELQKTKQQVEEKLDYNDRKIKAFQEMKDKSTNTKERELAQSKINEIENEKEELKGSLSTAEMKQMRTIKRSNKVIDKLIHDLESLDNITDQAKELPEVSARLEMLKLKLEDAVSKI